MRFINLSIILTLTLLTQSSALAQNEVELRTDGIVVPRTDTFDVISPSRGQIIYQDDASTLYYYNGVRWIAVTESSGSGTELIDTDGDTWVGVEEYPDADQIIFTIDSSEYGRLMKNDDGVIVLNLGNDGSQASHLVIGRSAGLNIDTSGFCCNTLIGDEAGRELTVGSTNVMLGTGAGRNTTTGGANTFIGTDAGENNVSGSSIVSVGQNAGFGVKHGIGNVFLGNNTAMQLDTGFFNTIIGLSAGERFKNGHRNIFIGTSSGFNSDTSNNNVAIGFAAGAFLAAHSDNNVLIGHLAGSHTKASNIVAIGNEAGKFNQAPGSIFIGDSSGVLTVGMENVFVGSKTGLANTLGFNNTFVGHNAGLSNTSGGFNTFIGRAAGEQNVSGLANTFIGHYAGGGNKTGGVNTYIGNFAGASGGAGNVAIGFAAGQRDTSGYDNVYIGNIAGEQNKNGHGNIYLGRASGVKHNGSNNTFVGKNSASNLTAGNGNIFIGNEAGADPSLTAVDNELYIDNSNTTSPLIHGFFDKDSLVINGDLYVTGMILPPSDINLKEEITPLDYNLILEKLESIDISEWQYKTNESRHIGPMAQDFYKAFGLGATDKAIATIDADGIALAAIKALASRNDKLEEEVDTLKAMMKELSERLSQLEE